MRLSTPAAIVIAGAMIALGVYLGLSKRAPLPVAGVAAAPAATTASAASLGEVEGQVRAALDSHRTMLRDKCLQDAAADPSYRGDWRLDYTFAPDGTQVIRGVTEHADAASARPTLTRCVFDALPPLRIPPPNATVQVEVAFSFP
jgi:hypothetical protein